MKLEHIFTIVLIIGIIARLFSLAVLPEEAYSDALFHLLLAKNVLATQGIGVFNGFTTDVPFYYALIASIFSLSMLPVSMPFVRIIPVILIALQIIFLFFVAKKLLNNSLIALSFAAIFPWLIRYNTVNYLDLIASMLLLCCVFLLLKFSESSKMAWIIALIAVVASLAISSRTASILAPFIILTAVFLLWKKHYSFKSMAVVLLALLVFSGLWFFLNVGKCGFVFCSTPSGDPEFTADYNNPKPFTLDFWLKSFLSFFDFPPQESFERIALLNAVPWSMSAAIFSIILLPVFLLLVFGGMKFWNEKNFAGRLIVILVIIEFLVALYISFVDERLLEMLYVRFLLVIMPLLALLFAKGFQELKQSHFKKIAAISLLLFALYSLAFTGVSAAYYNSIEQNHQGLYNFASTLPENAKIYSKVKHRAIEFNAERSAEEIIEFDKDFYAQPSEYIYSKIKEEQFTHLAEECYRNPWKQETINELIGLNKISLIFEDECVKVYEIK